MCIRGSVWGAYGAEAAVLGMGLLVALGGLLFAIAAIASSGGTEASATTG